ncbi:AI-2E family transporter [Leptolyngbya sp. 'hensonii']|uniref:AI-2E family transporter n=1 Tax=Leptolyngbya sp. 'hensonii' TaxID=1922337 RepID=UPI00094FE27D|nr:AI-2E family transporter [Leptolyngbya sp. 'hensonii']OLP16517.1 AI-2E family transporter [Leptolyngbya sp. 'hensonii']
MLESLKTLPNWLKLWLIFPLAFLNGWLWLLLLDYLQPLVSLLIAAIILAFLLNFPIRLLQERGMDRGAAIGLVLTIALLLIGFIAVTLVPLILEQLSGLVSSLPRLLQSGNEQIQSFQAWAVERRLPVDLTGIVDQAISQLSGILQATSSQLLSFFLSTISSLLNIALVLVLTIFMVLNGKDAWNGLFNWLPQPWNLTLQASIQQTFRRYFATQALLASILSLILTIAFLVLGVPYAVLFGVSIGLTTLIPYASPVTIVAVSLVVALQDFSLGLKVLVTAVIIGQLNDNILSPRLMGNTTGLNPIWLIIALFIGGKLGGILGLLIAVPLASVIKSTVDGLRSAALDTQ